MKPSTRASCARHLGVEQNVVLQGATTRRTVSGQNAMGKASLLRGEARVTTSTIRKERRYQGRPRAGLQRSASSCSLLAVWGEQVAEPPQSKAHPEVLDSSGPCCTGVRRPRRTPGSTSWPQPLACVSRFLSVPLPHPVPPFPVECRDTTRYCENVKQLKLCQLSQFQSRCCGTCGKA